MIPPACEYRVLQSEGRETQVTGVTMRHESTKFHLDTQYSAGLLNPIAQVLRELEERLAHYYLHLWLLEIDRQCVDSAYQVISETRRMIEELAKHGIAAQTWCEGR